MTSRTCHKIGILVVLALLVTQLFPLHLHVHNHDSDQYHEHLHSQSHLNAYLGYKHAEHDINLVSDETVIDLNKSSLISKTVSKKSSQTINFDMPLALIYLFIFIGTVLIVVNRLTTNLRKPKLIFLFIRPPLRAPPVLIA